MVERAKKVLHEAFGFVLLGYQIATSRIAPGTNVFSNDWDVLIVLDACRVDALESVKDEYTFLTEIESIWSVGSTSKEWIENTFVVPYRNEVAESIYVTSNPFTVHITGEEINRMWYPHFTDTIACNSSWFRKLIADSTLSGNELAYIDPVWKIVVNELPGETTTPFPSIVTERAIWTARSREWNRLIVHYMQPHAPYFREERPVEDLEEYERNPFEAYRNGTPREKIWNAYLDNLRFALDSVEVLLQNIDAKKVVITSDHGELFGELGLVSHGVGNPHPKLKKVPWAETTATDEGTISVSEQEFEDSDGISDEELTTRLEHLGYL